MKFNISILERANKHYGFTAQNMQLIQEMAEFIAVATKFWTDRTNIEAWKEHLEEFADVLVTCEGFKLRLTESELGYVQEQIDFKIDRLAKRMDKDKCN